MMMLFSLIVGIHEKMFGDDRLAFKCRYLELYKNSRIKLEYLLLRLRNTALYWFLPLLVIAMFNYVESLFWAYGALLAVYLIHPLFDLINLRKATIFLPRALMYVWVAGVFIAWFYSLRTSTNFEINQLILLSICHGLFAGTVAFTLAHELIHQPSKVLRMLGLATLFIVSHYALSITHKRVHHACLGTRQDPSSAQRGESIYRFIFRSYLGSQMKGLEIDIRRFCLYTLVWLSIISGIFVQFGWRGILFFLLQSAIAIAILEITQYVQHYGLERSIDQSGMLEPISSRHSWQTAYTSTNIFFLNLGYHADHHLRHHRCFSELEIVGEGNTHPYGNGLMILISLFPWLWRKIVDPRIPVSQRPVYESANNS